MKICRSTLLLGLGLLALSLPARAAVTVPTEWEPVGGEDVTTTGLVWDEWHGHLVFVTTLYGYRVFNSGDDSWTIHETPGDPLREVTALDGFPRSGLSHRLLTATRDADGHGQIELGSPLLRDEVVHTSRAGRVADIEVTGYYDPLAVACTRALDDIAGEVIASADTGATWQELLGHGHLDPTDLFCYSPDAFYVSGDAGVMYTPDGGATWEPRNQGLPAGTVWQLWSFGPGIAVPAKAERDEFPYLFASLADGVYYTETDVVAWQRVLEEIAPRQILVQSDPYGTVDDVFVVTLLDGRLLHARRGEWEWQDLGVALGEEVLVRGVASLYPDLYVVTSRDGLFRAEVFLQGPDAVPPDAPGLGLTAAPNPFNPGTTLSFTAAASGHARLTVHDLRGRHVATLLDAPVAAGPVTRHWRPVDLASGVYLARLSLGGRVATQRLVLVE